jgi:hypothetical protein
MNSWLPKIDSTDREYFKELQSNPSLTSFIGKLFAIVNGNRVVHLAHRISGPNGEFVGLIAAAIELRVSSSLARAAASGSAESLNRGCDDDLSPRHGR